ncbi:MAG: phenylacetic acid degradation operon negative regulatory protein [Parcubacteria group bacterium Gr01-1014_56]|nr:MAG: phenylacetic acid degradation operon negative regulatory protein [Parcubacteria group bacterium Gr01-1014_56]
MGTLEREVRAHVRRTKINKAIIGTLAIGGTLAVAVVAPNVLAAMGNLARRNQSQKRQTIKKSFSRLIGKGYIKIENNQARLTLRGEQFAALLNEGRLALKKPKRWDSKWRILIFDIPEKHKRIRERLRVTLISLGFSRLQDSVWVYPYDCEDLITFLKIDFRIGKDLLYIIADKIEGDYFLKEKFRLMK